LNTIAARDSSHHAADSARETSHSAASSAGSRDALVRFEGLQKSYDGETLVVKDLNLTISRGEFLTLLGPSGSGKTTTLMMLAGFEVPTDGHIYLDGQPIERLPPHKRNIGMVFQNYALFPHMSVEENVAFPLNVRRIGKAETAERVARALDMVQLGALGKRRPAQLSGGQQQRVALARALVFEPKLVLMDEPLGALDKQLREQMQLEIKHLHERLGITVVYVTHDQAEAMTMSDRIAVFNDGRIQQLAVPRELYESPVNSFVAQFIGENNKIKGTVRALDGGLAEVSVPSGETVKALAVNVAGVGAPTLLSVRPERVRIDPDPAECDNRFPARVEELIYLGDHVRARMAVLGAAEFVVKVGVTNLGRVLTPGAEVRVGWSSRDCRALDPL
jgi:putative spermidine/putrescine transport system ATP-binding protein